MQTESENRINDEWLFLYKIQSLDSSENNWASG